MKPQVKTNSSSVSHKENSDCCSSHSHSSEQEHDHDHSHESGSNFKLFFPAALSFLFLSIAIAIDNYFPQPWFSDYVRIIWYVVAYLPVGLPVLLDALKSIKRGDFFSEFFLMSIATIGAFGIGQYPEGVAVMLFYGIGEIFQSLAVSKAKSKAGYCYSNCG
jgi:Zn2+/Cd2+-exporting ATPase